MLNINFDLFYELKQGSVVSHTNGDVVKHWRVKNGNLEVKTIFLSAKNKTGIEDLKTQLLAFVNTGALRNNETIVTNTRH